MGLSTVTYALAKNYTDETAAQFGGLKGAPCKVKSIVKQNGQSIITFEQKNDEGETRESYAYVNDGTPIYEWTSGDTYKYGDLAIYASCFYRCIRENSDVVFDDTKWNEIGSPDGNYDIVQTAQDLPPRFTSADRKMYYSIADGFFYLWDGNEQVAQHQNYNELSNKPKINNTTINGNLVTSDLNLVDNDTLEVDANEKIAVKAIPYTYDNETLTLFATEKSLSQGG